MNGPDATQKAIDLVKEYNEKTGKNLASFKINEQNQTIVAVLDELSERVHQLVPHAGDQVKTHHHHHHHHHHHELFLICLGVS